MTKPMLLADFIRLPPTMRATAFDGLSGLIDKVAEAAPASHRFLRYQWYAAATAAYGLRARTLVVERDGDPVIALPFSPAEPRWLRLAMVPGSYWPFRGFPARADAEDTAFDVLLDRLAIEVNGLRVGPSYDGDPISSAVIAAARRRGWAVLDRFVAESFTFDLAAAGGEGWPRSSTLKKNRFLEKHLAEHGDLDWRFLSGAELAAGGMTRVEWGAGDSGYKRVIGAEPGPAIRDWLLLRPGVPALAGLMLRGVWRRSGRKPVPSAEA